MQITCSVFNKSPHIGFLLTSGLGQLTGPPSTQREMFQTMGQRFEWAPEQIKISLFPRENFKTYNSNLIYFKRNTYRTLI